VHAHRLCSMQRAVQVLTLIAGVAMQNLAAASADMKYVGEVPLFFGEYAGGYSEGWSVYVWPVSDEGNVYERAIGNGQTIGLLGPTSYFSECYIAIVSDCEVSNWTIRPLLSSRVGQFYRNVYGEPESFQGRQGKHPCLSKGALDILSGEMIREGVLIRMDRIGTRFAHYQLDGSRILNLDVSLISDLLGGTKFMLLLLAK